ncbi:MAG TPA: response regulator transcription factor, partial [Anaerolineales bacterium]|nr:response regulator transcription factor [Anaerolineales bacterium]
MMIRLLIADDHPVVRSGLRAILASQPDFELLAEADNGFSAVESAAKFQPDVILMDLQMPAMDGVSAIAKIHAANPSIYILVLTTYDTDVDILRALDAGATGYLLKDAPPDELFRAI